MSPSSGSGVGTPITGGGVGGTFQVTPLPYTLLSLPRYAQIMGISPAHFMRASGSSLTTPVFPVGSCGAVWPRHSWQNFDQVSHEELAYAIQGAETDIAALVGYWPAPAFISGESHNYPRPFDRTYVGIGLNLRGEMKTVVTEYARLISPGRRAVTLVGSASTAGGSLVYSDDDSDGLFETATITLPTALTTACEIKLYTAGYSGEPEYEIRPLRSVTVAGGNVTIKLDAWLLVRLDLLAAYPTSDGFRAIDISTTANYETSVDVYREYADSTQASATFTWGQAGFCASCGGAGCTVCQATTQSGCFYEKDANLGVVAPVPATYAVADAAWQLAGYWEGSIEPDQVKLWYLAGERSERYLRGKTCDPLSDWWAQTIAWVATARLERPLCGCGNVQTVAEGLARDMANAKPGDSYYNSLENLRNPLGTHRGEVMAWRRISRIARKATHHIALV